MGGDAEMEKAKRPQLVTIRKSEEDSSRKPVIVRQLTTKKYG
jgi:hypothetical protein